MALTSTDKEKLIQATGATAGTPEGMIIIDVINSAETLDEVYNSLQESIDRLTDAQTLVDIINNEF